MRIAVLLFTACISLGLFAQIPNGGFENWTSKNLDQLTSWLTIGNVSKSSDASAGNFSVKLENKVSNGTFGAITNANIGAGLTGGQAYTEIPLVMSFTCKHNLSGGDLARIIAVFKLQGTPLGVVDFTLNGNSADTFVTYNYAIQWGTQINPDSLIVVVSSTDLDNQNIQGDGYLIIDNIQFKTFSTPNAAVLNNDFENWGTIEIQHPTSWYTTDLFLQEQYNLPIQFNSVTKTSIAQSGSAAVHLKNVKPEDEIIPGVIMSGNDISAIEHPTFAVTQRWSYLQGLYKYLPDNNDVATIAALMYQNGTLLGTAQLTLSDTSNQDEYTYFAIPIQYLGGGIPDSASIIVSCADLENPVGQNTEMWVDNLSFTNHTASIIAKNITPVELYPNPATQYVYLKGMRPGYTYEVTSPLGHKIAEGTEPSISINNWESGLYTLKITDKHGLVHYIKFIKI